MRKLAANSFTILASLMLIFQLASCSGGSSGGGGGDSSSGGTTTSAATTYKTEDVANKAVSNLGDQAGVAILMAHDRGYSLRQIVEAVMANNLSSTGDISGQSPELTPQGFITRSSSGNPEINDAKVNRTLLASEWGKIVEERNLTVTNFILLWASEGYSVEQITQGIIVIDWDKISEDSKPELAIAYDFMGDPLLTAQPGVLEDSSTSGTDTGNGTDTGGGGDSSDGCYLTETTILGTWSSPRIAITDGYVWPCTHIFHANHTMTSTCIDDDGDSDSDSYSWSLDCNTVTLNQGGDSSALSVKSENKIDWSFPEVGITVPLSR